MLLTYAREGAWITWAVLKVVALRIWDRFLRLFVGGIPLHAAQLEHAATLNALLGRSDVFAVAADDEKRRKSDEADRLYADVLDADVFCWQAMLDRARMHLAAGEWA